MEDDSFAQNLMQKHGWKKGRGLGKTESGITDAIKPKLKFDTAGIGHNAGEQFSFHWWDHVFNKAAKNITVENSEDGVQVKQKGAKENLISNKRQTLQVKQKALMYGSFVKHGTLRPDGLISQVDAPSSSSSSSDDDSDVDDGPPESYEGNDEKLYKACGGRTAHKGARHGLHLSGKLRRIEEQENLHSNLMKKANQMKKIGLCAPEKDTRTEGCDEDGAIGGEDGDERIGEKKKKRKRKMMRDDKEKGAVSKDDEENVEEEDILPHEEVKDDGAGELRKKSKKKKRRCEGMEDAEVGNKSNLVLNRKNTSNEDVASTEGDEAGGRIETPRKKKRTKKSETSRPTGLGDVECNHSGKDRLGDAVGFHGEAADEEICLKRRRKDKKLRRRELKEAALDNIKAGGGEGEDESNIQDADSLDKQGRDENQEKKSKKKRKKKNKNI